MNEDINYFPEKLKSMIHYIISKCDSNTKFNKKVMHNLMYFSDFNYYELYEIPITGEKYIKKTNEPPLSLHFLELINELIKQGKIKEITEKEYKYNSLKKPDISCLNKEEIDVINDTINKISHMSAKEINNYSNGDLPWRVAENNEELDYEFVFYRDPEYVIREYND